MKKKDQQIVPTNLKTIVRPQLDFIDWSVGRSNIQKTYTLSLEYGSETSHDFSLVVNSNVNNGGSVDGEESEENSSISSWLIRSWIRFEVGNIESEIRVEYFWNIKSVSGVIENCAMRNMLSAILHELEDR